MVESVVERDDTATIVIRRAHVSQSLPGALSVFPDSEWDGTQLLVRIGGAARYLITKSRIDVDPVDGADFGDVRAFLLGTVFGALCYLRGIFPLHASAVEFPGGCVAFAGESGAGKSTMAAALAARGLQVLTDDVSYLRKDAGDTIRIWAGINRVRLWESAMTGLDISRLDADREFRGYNKFLLPMRLPANPAQPRLLQAVYQLANSPQLQKPNFMRLRGAAAFEALLGNIYRQNLAEQIGLKAELFAFVAEVARRVPVFRFNRAMDFRALDDALDGLLDHVQEVLHDRLPAGA
jgi:hypothetical protein